MAGDESGRAQVSEEEILGAISTAIEKTGAPAVSTSNVAELLPISRQAVKRRLENLADEGKAGRHAAGRNRIWWVADEEYSGTKVDFEELVEIDDLSDERLVLLLKEQVDIESLSDIDEEFLEDVIDTHLSPDDIDEELLYDKLRSMEYSNLPGEITSGVAESVYGYDASYWGKRYRYGIFALAMSMMILILSALILAASSDPPGILVNMVGETQAESIVNDIGLFIGFIWLLTLAYGVLSIILGGLGGTLSDNDEPFWRGYWPALKNRARENLFD